MKQSTNRLIDDRRRAGEEWLTWAREDQFTEAERQTVIAPMALLERLTRLWPEIARLVRSLRPGGPLARVKAWR